MRAAPDVCERDHIASVALTLFVAVLVVANLPPSDLRRAVLPRADPVLTATGLRQAWDVFAPDPRAVSYRLKVQFRYAAGPDGDWAPPRDGLSVFSGDRWVKLTERAHEPGVGLPLLVWAIENRADPGRRVVAARLVRAYRSVAPAGAPEGEAPPYRDEVLLTAG